MAKKPEKSKRFKYNLAAVLKVRKIKETQEQEKFNEAQKKAEEELRKEQELKAQQNQEFHELREVMGGTGEVGDMDDIMRRKAHLDVLKVQVEEQIKVREDAEAAREEQREVLIQAVKERKIIEKDREKKREAWKKLMDKEEAKFLDDIAGVGYVRRSRA